MSAEDPSVVVEAYADAEPVMAEYEEANEITIDDDGMEEGYKVEEIPEGVQVEDDEGEEDDALVGDGKGGLQFKGLNPLDSMDGYTILIALLTFSIVEFVAAIVAVVQLPGGEVNDNYGLCVWAVVGGLFSILTAAAMMVLKKCKEELSIKISPWLSLWLMVLWISIVMPCTFAAPFASLGNGYLGSWASLICAGTLAARAFADRAASVRKAFESQTQSEAGKWSLVCGLASIVVMIAGAFKFGTDGPVSYMGYAVSCAVISVLGCVIILIFLNVANLKAKSGLVNTIISIFLAVWWVLGAFILTFVDPFNLNGGGTDPDATTTTNVDSCSGFNGYFATFGATFAAMKLFQACGLDFVKSKMAGLSKKSKGSGGESNESEENPPL